MKRKEWRYTEHAIDSDPKSGPGWLKLVLTYIVVSPLRLVNEISQKILFLGSDVLRKVCMYGFLINCGFIAWAIFWDIIADTSKPFLPFPVMFISTGLTGFLYMSIGKVRDFDYEIIQCIDEEDEELSRAVDLEEVTAFDKTAADDVTFNDSINLFIKDPEELSVLGITPAAYQEAEESRLLNAIEKRTDIFPIENIPIPASLEGPPLDSQLEDNFNALMAELEQQQIRDI